MHAGTEEEIHTDDFFLSQDMIVNALDNVEARVYIDQRCVDTGRPLLESGTTGAKGHTQIIVPHLTESYSSQVSVPPSNVITVTPDYHRLLSDTVKIETNLNPLQSGMMALMC